MATSPPQPLSPAALRARRSRIIRIARQLGFVGQVEYRHVYSRTGGAQYGQGSVANRDLLTVFVEAFERDADPSDFSLAAILAHERGHQIVARHERISQRVAGRISADAEEIVASLLGAIIVQDESDKDCLMGKAIVELINRGEVAEIAVRRLRELRDLLEELL